jgi:hypothetical protein
MKGRAPRLKQKVKAMLNRQTALELVGAGLPVSEVARQLSITVQSVRRLLRQSLASESLFPNNLPPEKISELRQLEGEKMRHLWQRLHESLNATRPQEGMVRARLAEASVRVSERLSRLFGLDQPTRLIEESFKLSYERKDQTITLAFDQSLLNAPVRDTALVIDGEEAPSNELPNPATAQVAETVLK